MKTVFLVRHAKSSWKEPRLADIERTLNNRGRRDAPFMAGILRERGAKPQRLFSSPAVRALKTAGALEIELGVGAVSIEEELYGAASGDLLRLIRSSNDTWVEIMIVGHNPGLLDLVNLLCGGGADRFPTAAAACIDFETSSWKRIEGGAGRIRFLTDPESERRRVAR